MIMKTRFALLLLVFFIFAFSACKKSADEEPDLGYNYFPDKVGAYIIYDVDSTFYDDFFIPTKLTKFKFQLKEKYESIFQDNQNRPTIRIERYIKKYDSIIPYADMQWKLRNVWFANKTATTAERVEDNMRFIRLAFPVKITQSWDGNVQNVDDEQTYSYSFIDEAKTLAGHSFEKVLKVKQIDYTDLIQKKYAVEQYARTIGLIYREVITIYSQYNGLPGGESAYFAIPIMNRIKSGSKYTWVYNTNGIE